MSYQVIIEAEAEENLKEAALWLAQYSLHKAGLWYFEMLDKIDSLAEMPFRCPLAPENAFFDEEIRHLLAEQYRIIYTIRATTVHILYVRHSARLPARPVS